MFNSFTMPSSIPYDPSLVLGGIITPEASARLNKIATLKAQVDTAHDILNSFIATQHSLFCTKNELADININTEQLENKEQELAQKIIEAAQKYLDIQLINNEEIQKIQSEHREFSSAIESPVNYSQSKLQHLPLASDSLKFDCQYFAYDKVSSSQSTHIAKIKSHIDKTVSTDINTSDVSATILDQISGQHANHEIQGTLIISAVCTHKNAVLFAPLELDIDHALGIWNKYLTSPTNQLDPDKPASMILAAKQPSSAETLDVITGALYGSCFVGMVHILRKQKSNQTENFDDTKTAEKQMVLGAWLQQCKGEFGVADDVVESVKNLLNSQEMSTHINIVTMGVIPSTKSLELREATASLTNQNADNANEYLKNISNTTNASHQTLYSGAQIAQIGGQLMAIKNSIATNTLLNLHKIDSKVSSNLDLNSLMTAFDNYIVLARSDSSSKENKLYGVPTNYLIQKFTKQQLAQIWLKKYYATQNEKDELEPSTQKPAKTTAEQ